MYLASNGHPKGEKAVHTLFYVTSSWKTRLMEEHKDQALIRCRAFCAASDQSLDFL